MVLPHHVTERAHERLRSLFLLGALLNDRPTIPGPQHHERVLAQERVAGDVLPTLDALQQERVVGMFSNLEEGRYRCQEVRHHLLAYRDERALFGERGELFK